MAVELNEFVLELQSEFRIACKRWRLKNGSRRRVLCYPGWLDNAGSFDTLAPLIAAGGYDVVAVDPPGCGLSQHLPKCSMYNDFEEAAMIPDMLDALEWREEVTLVAHSRGGGIALAAAAAFPSYVNAVVLYDSKIFSLGGVWGDELCPPHETIMRGRVADQKNLSRKPKVFATLDDVIQHNQKNKVFPKSLATATNITMRHVKQLPNGSYTFTHDVRTYGQRQKANLSAEQNLELMKGVKVPVHHIYGTLPNAIFAMRFSASAPGAALAGINARKNAISNLTEDPCEGHHHVHSDNPTDTAKLTLRFLETKVYQTSKL